MFATHIDPEELQVLPLQSFDGPVHVIESASQAVSAIKRLSKARVLGFDTETKPSFKKGKNHPVSLLQFATPDEAWLFRLQLIGRVPELARLCADAGVIKVGAAIRDDIRPLKALFGVEPAGFVDLQDIVKNYGIQNFGLKKLSAIVLGFRISKSQQLSNWDAESLTESQIRYAATDAWVTLAIYLKLLESKNNNG